MSESKNKDSELDADPEFRQFLDELWERLPGFARKAAEVTPSAKGSTEWYTQIGRFWREARQQSRKSVNEVAKAMGVHINQIYLFDSGLPTEDDMKFEFWKSYAEALGKPDLVYEFMREFDL